MTLRTAKNLLGVWMSRPAIESEAVFASRTGKQPEGVPVYISHDPSLSIGRVTDIRYGQA